MSDQVITSIEQVTAAWLTSVLAGSGALVGGAVAAFDVKMGRGSWSTNATLKVRYVKGSQGSLPARLFLKLVNTNSGEETFDSSEVTYYTRDYLGVADVPLIRCYDAVFSEELGRYHVLLDDLSETHVTAADKLPTLEYGLALADGLAALHAHRWDARRFTQVGAAMHSTGDIRRFVDIAESGVRPLLDQFVMELEPHWPDFIHDLYERHPQALIERIRDDNGFTLVHGDVGHHNILVPHRGDRPIYIIDRQPFGWALTTWLGVYDVAYAIVLDWDVETRRNLEIPLLKRYHDQLIQHGVKDYSWEQLYEDYRLCAAMCVYVATEYFRSGEKRQWVSEWLLMLRRALIACDDLDCSDQW
jgi:hypothetical protein